MSKENDNRGEIDSKALDKFFGAISRGDLDVVKEMCEGNPGIVNLKNSRGDAPLHVAVDRNNLKMMGLLIKKGADVDCLDAGNKTPLLLVMGLYMWELKLDHPDREKAVELLVRNKADVNVVDMEKETALYKAIERDEKKLVKYLCNNGAKVHVEGARDPIVLAKSKLAEATRKADSTPRPDDTLLFNPRDHGEHGEWVRFKYYEVNRLRRMVDILERTAYQAEHPSVFKQAKQMVVNALGNMSLGNSSTTPSAASSSQAKQKTTRTFSES